MSKKDLDKGLEQWDTNTEGVFEVLRKPLEPHLPLDERLELPHDVPLKPFEPKKFVCPLHGVQNANPNGGCPIPGCPYS